MIERAQLLELGFSGDAIEWRIKTGRLHRTPYPGIYAVGRPTLTRKGNWLAAVRSCGPGAALSHGSAAGLWAFGVERIGRIEVSVPAARRPRGRRIRVHRRSAALASLVVISDRIPVTCPELTIIDMSSRLSADGLDAMISKADVLELTDPPKLRALAAANSRIPGAARVRDHLDRQSFRLTRSALERFFLPVYAELGMPVPQTRRIVNGFEVDFFSPEIDLVVETDGLGYHRTPAQQAKDRIRDQTHTAAGMVPLRFTHAQVKWKPAYVRETLAAVCERLRGEAKP